MSSGENLNSIMPDPSKRFSATPLETSLALEGVKLCVATNNQGLRDRLRSHFPPRAGFGGDVRMFFLRIIVEPEDESGASGDVLPIHDFEFDGLGYVTIGQRSFLAYDRKEWQGFSFVTSQLVGDDEQFKRYFLEALLLMLQRIGPLQ